MSLIENAKLAFNWDDFFSPFIDLNFVSFFCVTGQSWG